MMQTPVEKIENKIISKNITLVLSNFDNLRAFSVKVDDNYAIGVNPKAFNSSKELHTALAHEYYHCEGNFLYKMEDTYQFKSKQEFKTNYYMALEMLPPKTLKYFLEQAIPVYEISEFLDLTEEFINTAILIYKAKGLI